MNLFNRGARTVLLILGFSLIQGCATSRPPCSAFIQSHDYLAATDHKAIAQYFDRETSQPPRRMEETATECWYISEASTAEDARQDVLEACTNSLAEMNKQTEWNCVLVAAGDQPTPAEKERLWEKARRSLRYAERRTTMVYVEPQHIGPERNVRTPTSSPRDKNK